MNALQASNVIVPAGTARIGDREYNVQLNSSPTAVDRFNALPIGVFNGAPVTLGDVGHVSDSFATQTNVVHVNGKRAVYLAILKHADASTLAVVDAARDALPEIQAAAPAGLELKLDFDQSVFVRAAVQNVIREAIISSILVSLLILVFLGSWRNTVIVSASIPLSIFAGIIGLFLTGNTINLMTLGGLALAIGLLVDNATVTIENIHRNQSLGKPLTVAILDGSSEVIQPLTVATLAICIVFFPVVLLFGVARYLFIPLAVTVVFCMLASYVLSFTRGAELRALPAGVRDAAPRPAARLLRRCSTAASTGSATATAGCWKARCSGAVRADLRRRTAGGVRRAGHGHRPRLLPDRRCRPDQAALSRAGRHAAGTAPRSSCSRSRTASARSFRRTNWIPSTTRSACRPRSTWPSCRATMSARWMPRS